MYLVYLENWQTKKRIYIGVFSTYPIADDMGMKASQYWNTDIEDAPYLLTIVQIVIDEAPSYLK